MEPKASVEKTQANASGTLKTGKEMAVRNETLVQTASGEGGHVEYTELALDCLDLKAQEELLSPPVSGNYKMLLSLLS